MVAMLAAFGAEIGSHRPVFQQVQTAPLLVAAAFITVIVASIIPVVRKADLSVQGAGPFTQVCTPAKRFSRPLPLSCPVLMGRAAFSMYQVGLHQAS